jgi:3-hydroxyisobutyrate dehydrogenase-like beta-hydroxyacid dehydrogenase
MTLMLGGNPVEIEAATPVFETFARLIVRVGDIGSGQLAKLINNTLAAANIAVARNALLGGEKLGLDRDALLQIMRASSGQSFGMEVAGRMTSPKGFAHGAMVLTKDVGLLGEVLGESDLDYASLRDAAMPLLKLATA